MKTIQMTYNEPKDEYDLWLVDGEDAIHLKSFSDFVEAVEFRDEQREVLAAVEAGTYVFIK